MKIKAVKKLNLLELIQYIIDNEELRGLHYAPTQLGGGVKVSKSGEVLVENIWADDTFAVEVEEELTEDTEFGTLWELYYDTIDKKPETWVHFQTSVSKILDENSKEIDNITLAIYYGSTLIWSKDTGIPSDGVLEVDEG